MIDPGTTIRPHVHFAAALAVAIATGCGPSRERASEGTPPAVTIGSSSAEVAVPQPRADASLRDKILGVNAHVIVLKYSAQFPEYAALGERIARVPGVTALEPFSIAPFMFVSGKDRSEVLVKGVDPERMPKVLDLPKHVVSGSLAGLRFAARAPGDAGRNIPSCASTADTVALPGIVLGHTLAARRSAVIGSCVELTTEGVKDALSGETPDAGTARHLAFRVIATFDTDFEEYDTRLAYIALRAWQNMMENGDTVTGLELRVDDVERAGEVAGRIRAAIHADDGLYKVMDWRELNAGRFGDADAGAKPAR